MDGGFFVLLLLLKNRRDFTIHKEKRSIFVAEKVMLHIS